MFRVKGDCLGDLGKLGDLRGTTWGIVRYKNTVIQVLIIFESRLKINTDKNEIFMIDFNV